MVREIEERLYEHYLQAKVQLLKELTYYLEHFATLIEQNILKDSNDCFDSLAIRLWSEDLKHLNPGNRPPGLQG